MEKPLLPGRNVLRFLRWYGYFIYTGFSENRLNPRIYILEVGRCVSFETQYFVPVEDDITRSILGKVEVFYGAGSYHPGNLFPFIFIKSRVFLCYDIKGPALCFIEEIREINDISLSTGKVSVLKLHNTEIDMLPFNIPSQPVGDVEYLLKMGYLPVIRYINYSARVVFL